MSAKAGTMAIMRRILGGGLSVSLLVGYIWGCGVIILYLFGWIAEVRCVQKERGTGD